MSTTDGDASSRLSKAIDDIFGGSAEPPAGESSQPAQSEAEPAGAEPYVLPEIVPATADWSVEDDEPPAQQPPVAPVPPPATAGAPAQQAAPAREATQQPAYWAAQPATAVAPGYPAPLRAAGRRPRVRKVTRVVRHIDPWSTFKVALIFSAVTYIVLLTAGVLLWRVADSTGTIDNVERWFTQFGWETFELKGDEIFDQAWVIGLFAAVGLTGAIVLFVTLFNLVSDIVGGVRMTVLEEEVVERTISSTRRYVVRRPPVDGESDHWDVDSDEVVPTERSPTADFSVAGAPATADWSVDD